MQAGAGTASADTVRCLSCEATFPESRVPPPRSGPCPRCGQLLFAPRPARPHYAQPKLGTLDLLRPSLCRICGCILSGIERSGPEPTCRHPACLHRLASIEGAARQKHDIAVVEAFLRERTALVERTAVELGIDLDPGPAIAILPSKTGRLVPMTEDRRRELARRLKQIAREIADDTTDPVEVEPPPAPPTRPALPTVVGQACATCRGYCCRHGGNRGYLTRATFERVLAQCPTLSPDDLRAAYLKRVPRESMDGSCIFHGKAGCTLEPVIRSDTCNDYFCDGARGLAENPGGARLAAAVDSRRVVRLALIGGADRKLLFDLEET